MNEESPTPDPEGTYEPSLESLGDNGTAAESQPKLGAHALQTGVYVGVTTIVIALIRWLIDPESVTDTWDVLGILSLVATLGLVIYFGRNFAAMLPKMSYGKAYGYSLRSLLVSSAFGFIWLALLFHVIDTDLLSKIKEKQLDEMYEKLLEDGKSEESIEQTMSTQEKAMDFYLGNAFIHMGAMIASLLFFSLVFSLITSVGIVIGRKAPEPSP